MSAYRGLAIFFFVLGMILATIDASEAMILPDARRVDRGVTVTLLLASCASGILARGEGRKL